MIPRGVFLFYGNTAQFPPCGLSTAPAAAAPRSPYRHLELCGIALKPLGGGHAPVLNVFIIPRGLPERKKNFWPGGAELADLIKIKYGIQRIKALTCVGAVAKIDK